MSKYFIDCEFIEGKQDKTIFGIKYGKTKSTIDLISIGIVSEDNREYYAISKDFNLEEAWNRYDLVKKKRFQTDYSEYNEKVYWIRENVLKPIFVELFIQDNDLNKEICLEQQNKNVIENKMTFYWLQQLITKYGKTNKQIAKEIQIFTANLSINGGYENENNVIAKVVELRNQYDPVEFYGYYSAYDHVVLCQLFGKMIDLPTGFPMYTIDLKQELDRMALIIQNNWKVADGKGLRSFEECLNRIKSLPNYPKQMNEHNALEDAYFCYNLYKFLNKLKNNYEK